MNQRVVSKFVAIGGQPTRAAIKLVDPPFDRASNFLRRRGGKAADSASRPWFTDFGGAAAVIRVVRALPVLDVRLTHSPAGTAIRAELAGRSLGVPRIRLCAAVREVPADVPDRPSGKRNQALRTALSAGHAAGMTVQPVPDLGERQAIADHIVRSSPWRQKWSQTIHRRDAEQWLVAFDHDGSPVGVGAVLVDREWASLVTLIGVPGSPLQSHARYTLHHRLLQLLSHHRVQYVGAFEHSPLLLPPETRHLQRIMGYLPVRLRPPIELADGIACVA